RLVPLTARLGVQALGERRQTRRLPRSAISVGLEQEGARQRFVGERAQRMGVGEAIVSDERRVELSGIEEHLGLRELGALARHVIDRLRAGALEPLAGLVEISLP